MQLLLSLWQLLVLLVWTDVWVSVQEEMWCDSSRTRNRSGIIATVANQNRMCWMLLYDLCAGISREWEIRNFCDISSAAKLHSHWRFSFVLYSPIKAVALAESEHNLPIFYLLISHSLQGGRHVRFRPRGLPTLHHIDAHSLLSIPFLHRTRNLRGERRDRRRQESGGAGSIGRRWRRSACRAPEHQQNPDPQSEAENERPNDEQQ